MVFAVFLWFGLLSCFYKNENGLALSRGRLCRISFFSFPEYDKSAPRSKREGEVAVKIKLVAHKLARSIPNPASPRQSVGNGQAGPTHLDFQGQIDGIQVERRS
jgi:hypothetical protein